MPAAEAIGRRYVLATLTALAVLGIFVYLPFLSLPLIADDYVQIRLARDYGSISGWAALASDPLYRCRATSLILTYWTEYFFGISPLALNWSSVILHVLNAWLVFALGVWRSIGWRVSALAAAFFAVYEGHQEAVVWYSATPELLVFFFSMLSFLFWVLWVQSTEARFRYYAAALVSFVLALASKESAVAVVPLLILALSIERVQRRRRLAQVAPFAALAAFYAGLIFASRSAHLHFHDAGTFSLRAPFPITWSISIGRLLWIWGLLSLVALAIWQAREWRRLQAVALAWIGITLLPYSFLTYMPRVPSRHTYFASAGLGMMVAAGLLAFRARFAPKRPWAAAVLAAVIVAHNGTYLWTKKYTQYVERAAPTEALIRLARRTPGRIFVHCFPYDRSVAGLAIELMAGRSDRDLVWDPRLREDKRVSAVFCWDATRAKFQSKGAHWWGAQLWRVVRMAFEKEKLVYHQHRDAWQREHRGKFAVIKEEELIGTFSSIEDAYAQALRRLGDNHFLIVRVNGDGHSFPHLGTVRKQL